MRRRREILAAAILAFALGCGGGSGPTYSLTGTATATGTVGGQSMAPTDAISNVVPQGSSSAGAILISTTPTLCSSVVSAARRLKNAKSLAIVIGIQSGTSVSPPTVGTYTVYTQAGANVAQGNVSTALFAVSDVNCNSNPIQSTGGTITLTRVDATGYTGTFSISFGTDQLNGSFNTGTCSGFPSNATTTCPP